MFSPSITAQPSQVNFGKKTHIVTTKTLKATVERFLKEDNTDAAINYLVIQINQGNPNVSTLGESHSNLVSRALVRSTQANKAPYQR